jgi:hypothetical protein
MGLEGGFPEKKSVFLTKVGKVPGAKEAALAASLLGGSPLLEGIHSEAHAAEIAPTASWQQGAETLHQLQQNERNEFFAIYVQSKEKGAWAKMSEGISNLVQPSKETMADAKAKIESIGKESGGEAHVCVIHTHPQAVIERVVKKLFDRSSKDSTRAEIEKHAPVPILYAGQRLPDEFNSEGVLSMPPSFDDAYVYNTSSGWFGLPAFHNPGYKDWLEPHGVKTHETAAVFDTHGIWYYQRFESPEKRELYVKEIVDTIPEDKKEILTRPRIGYAEETWMTYANGYVPQVIDKLVQDPAYKGLQYFYARQNDGVKLDFVPWEDVLNRQPCSPEKISHTR